MLLLPLLRATQASTLRAKSWPRCLGPRIHRTQDTQTKTSMNSRGPVTQTSPHEQPHILSHEQDSVKRKVSRLSNFHHYGDHLNCPCQDTVVREPVPTGYSNPLLGQLPNATARAGNSSTSISSSSKPEVLKPWTVAPFFDADE